MSIFVATTLADTLAAFNHGDTEAGSDDSSTSSTKAILSYKEGKKVGDFSTHKIWEQTLLPSRRTAIHKSDLLVLMDIDATMVCTKIFETGTDASEYIKKIPKGSNGMPVTYIQAELGGNKLVVNVRPGLMTFLKALAAQCCEVHIFTAGTSTYANFIAQLLDPDRTIFAKNGIWSRDDGDCVHVEPRMNWKNLSRLQLGRNGDLSRVVLIDDNERTLLANPANMYYIPPFTDDSNDNEFEKAWQFLSSHQLFDKGDVRPVLRNEFYNTAMAYHRRYPFDYGQIKAVELQLQRKDEQKQTATSDIGFSVADKGPFHAIAQTVASATKVVFPFGYNTSSQIIP